MLAPLGRAVPPPAPAGSAWPGCASTAPAGSAGLHLHLLRLAPPGSTCSGWLHLAGLHLHLLRLAPPPPAPVLPPWPASAGVRPVLAAPSTVRASLVGSCFAHQAVGAFRPPFIVGIIAVSAPAAAVLPGPGAASCCCCSLASGGWGPCGRMRLAAIPVRRMLRPPPAAVSDAPHRLCLAGEFVWLPFILLVHVFAGLLPYWSAALCVLGLCVMSSLYLCGNGVTCASLLEGGKFWSSVG